MSDQNIERYIELFGTDEQKEELEERKDRLSKWISNFPVLTIEDAMNLSTSFGRYKEKAE